MTIRLGALLEFDVGVKLCCREFAKYRCVLFVRGTR